MRRGVTLSRLSPCRKAFALPIMRILTAARGRWNVETPYVVIAMLGTTLLLIVNCTAFVLFYYDKHAARDRLWRVSEGTLLPFALIGGSVGTIAGQQVMRHRTRKEPFRTMLYSIAALQVVGIGWLILRPGF